MFPASVLKLQALTSQKSEAKRLHIFLEPKANLVHRTGMEDCQKGLAHAHGTRRSASVAVCRWVENSFAVALRRTGPAAGSTKAVAWRASGLRQLRWRQFPGPVRGYPRET